MKKYMTEFGINALKQKIKEFKLKHKDALKKAGESAAGDSNSYHDNFDYEQGMRDQEMYAKMVQNLLDLLTDSIIVSMPTDNIKIAIGHIVRIEDINSGEIKDYLIGGNGEGMLFKNIVSAGSPLGRALIGLSLYDETTIQLPQRKISVCVTNIRTASKQDFDVLT